MDRYNVPAILLLLISIGLFSLMVIDTSAVTTQQFQNETRLCEYMVDASVVLSIGGSGVFIADNVILTAAHVLEGETSATIELRDGTILKSNDFYIDEKEDVGFIFVDANELGIAKISPRPLGIGESVHLVGTPYHSIFAFSLSKGIVSHLDRDLSDMGWENLLQVDAEGGSGSSGGPLYDSNGNLVGMYVGHAGNGGRGISLCEDAKSILEAYERYKDAANVKRY